MVASFGVNKTAKLLAYLQRIPASVTSIGHGAKTLAFGLHTWFGQTMQKLTQKFYLSFLGQDKIQCGNFGLGENNKQ